MDQYKKAIKQIMSENGLNSYDIHEDGETSRETSRKITNKPDYDPKISSINKMLKTINKIVGSKYAIAIVDMKNKEIL